MTAAYVSQKLMEMFRQPGGTVSSPQEFSDVFAVFSAMPAEQLVFVFMVYGFMFLCGDSFILLLYLLNRVNRVYPPAPHAPELSPEIQPRGKAKGLLWLLPGLMLILLWFYVQANGFMGMQNVVTETFRFLIGAAS